MLYVFSRSLPSILRKKSESNPSTRRPGCSGPSVDQCWAPGATPSHQSGWRCVQSATSTTAAPLPPRATRISKPACYNLLLPQIMLRSLHLLLGFGVVSPFLLQGKPRSLAALPSIAALSNPRGLSSTLPIARSRYGACFGAVRMSSGSSGDSETSAAADVASAPAVAPPVVRPVDFPRPIVRKESDLWPFYCGLLISSSLMDRCRVSTLRTLGRRDWWDFVWFIENLDFWFSDGNEWKWLLKN